MHPHSGPPFFDDFAYPAFNEQQALDYLRLTAEELAAAVAAGEVLRFTACDRHGCDGNHNEVAFYPSEQFFDPTTALVIAPVVEAFAEIDPTGITAANWLYGQTSMHHNTSLRWRDPSVLLDVLTPEQVTALARIDASLLPQAIADHEADQAEHANRHARHTG